MTFFVTLSKALLIPHKNHFYIMASTSIAILSLCVILARWAGSGPAERSRWAFRGKGLHGHAGGGNVQGVSQEIKEPACPEQEGS